MYCTTARFLGFRCLNLMLDAHVLGSISKLVRRGTIQIGRLELDFISVPASSIFKSAQSFTKPWELACAGCEITKDLWNLLRHVHVSIPLGAPKRWRR